MNLLAFLEFVVRRLALNHSSTKFACKLQFLRSTCKLLSLNDRHVSSANKLIETLEAFSRSFVYNRNNIGPKTEPCGTPHKTVNQSEKKLR